MKRESKFYTIIKNSCDESGAFYHKIPDTFPSNGEGVRFTTKKPFDLIVVYTEKALFIEVKYSKELKAFSVQKNLSEHQNENLQIILNNSDKEKYFIRPVVVLGIYRPREIKRIYIFDYEWLKKNPQKKKDIESIELFIDVKSKKMSDGKRKDCFDIGMFYDKIIKGSVNNEDRNET